MRCENENVSAKKIYSFLRTTHTNWLTEYESFLRQVIYKCQLSGVDNVELDLCNILSDS